MSVGSVTICVLQVGALALPIYFLVKSIVSDIEEEENKYVTRWNSTLL